MDPLCPDDETDSEFQQFIDDQIDTIPQDFEELKNGTLLNVADSSDPVFAHNEDSSMLPQVIQHQLATLQENFDEFEKTMLHPYEMDPMDSQNLSEWNFARANQDKYMIIQDGTQKEGQFLMEGTHNFTENMNVISYMSHCSSGGGCISGGSEVAGPFVKCANEISYGGSGGAVRSFTKYGFLVQYGNGMNVWRWMGGSATTTRARAEPKALRKKKKRKCRGQFETETAATARHEHQKIKNRAAAAQSFQQKQAYEVQLHTHIQKLRKENEFHKKLLTFLKTHNSKNHEKLRKEKQIPIEENDDDYRPSEAEDGSDTESYDSFEHEEQSKGNIANRERMYTKHRCGSRSIPIRVEKLIGLGWHFLRATMM